MADLVRWDSSQFLAMTNFVKALRQKGWSAKVVAARWGLLPRQISRIGNKPSQKYLDALEGLPVIVKGTIWPKNTKDGDE